MRVPIELLRALAKQGRQDGTKVFRLLDNVGMNHSKPVEAWLA
jgi:hypothetical protein